MAKELYALQRDLDMVALQVNELTKALSNLDEILHRVINMELEQKFQAAQMRRMEDEIRDFRDEISDFRSEIGDLRSEMKKIASEWAEWKKEWKKRKSK